MRILIVEDEKRLAGTLQDLLRRQGYTADVCYDGISGLDNARSDIYDLLVLDAMLPGMDGFALLRHSACRTQRERRHDNENPVMHHSLASRQLSSLATCCGPRTMSPALSPLLTSIFTPSLRPVVTLRLTYCRSLPSPRAT